MARRPKNNGGSAPAEGSTIIVMADAAPAKKPRQPRQPAGFIKRTQRSVRKINKQGGFLRKEVAYAAVSSDIGIQVGCSMSEAAASMAMSFANMIVKSTDTTIDDKTFPWVAGLISTGVRWYADTKLSRKHAGLAKVLSAGASSANGVNWSQKFLDMSIKAQENIGKKP